MATYQWKTDNTITDIDETWILWQKPIIGKARKILSVLIRKNLEMFPMPNGITVFSVNYVIRNIIQHDTDKVPEKDFERMCREFDMIRPNPGISNILKTYNRMKRDMEETKRPDSMLRHDDPEVIDHCPENTPESASEKPVMIEVPHRFLN